MINLVENFSKEAGSFFGEWSRLTGAIFSTAEFKCEAADSVITCTFSLPGEEEFQLGARNPDELVFGLLDVLQKKIRSARSRGEWAPEWKVLLSEKDTSTKQEAGMALTSNSAKGVDRTKERQVTVGVTSKTSLYEKITSVAKLEGSSTARVARRLFVSGLDEFENRSFSENPRRLLEKYESNLERLDGTETMQWMLRMSRHESLRLKFSAQEYSRSASQLAALCLHEAYLMSYAECAASIEIEVAAAREAVQNAKGPITRKLAERLGFSRDSAPLISGVLSGRIAAPSKLYQGLSRLLNITERALRTVSQESFRSAPVPSFKASTGKPSVVADQEDWASAVKSLALPDDEAEKLLNI
jgi:hypothetical protein